MVPLLAYSTMLHSTSLKFTLPVAEHSILPGLGYQVNVETFTAVSGAVTNWTKVQLLTVRKMPHAESGHNMDVDFLWLPFRSLVIWWHIVSDSQWLCHYKGNVYTYIRQTFLRQWMMHFRNFGVTIWTYEGNVNTAFLVDMIRSEQTDINYYACTRHCHFMNKMIASPGHYKHRANKKWQNITKNAHKSEHQPKGTMKNKTIITRRFPPSTETTILQHSQSVYINMNHTEWSQMFL